jgi:predicted nucleic acid-binding protein
VASSLIIAETLTLPPGHRESELAGYLDFFALPNLSLIPVDNAIARRAAELSMRHNLGTPDAVHLATALAAKAEVFITNDRKLKRVEGLTVITVDDL